MPLLRTLQAAAPRPADAAFKAYKPGYEYLGLKYLPQNGRQGTTRYLLVAYDRATR
ncbi:hypothetical protein [Paracoccus rhizosphaerae]|uniref:hypothetical protein n=1 Tax=Paracoccus rhizosphaerae TaxID=1133347 RepID=UPI003612CAF5